MRELKADTGVGKSTLVRAMITVGVVEQKRATGVDWNTVFVSQTYGPLARNTSANLATLPTSVGVHLYRDQTLLRVRSPRKTLEDVPMLFADCEGFAAGSMVTDAEQAATHEGMNSKYISRQIVIKAPEFKDKGKTSAELFYARFLYAFSDVVVFVINQDQKMMKDLQRLLEWTVSAVKKSISRNSPKTLLIVRNAPRAHSTDYYNENDLNSGMFQHLGSLWADSTILSEYKANHDRNCTRLADKIHDNEAFFLLFFRQIKICYVPSNLKDEINLYSQYVHLRNQIVKGVCEGQMVRSNSWTRYDVPSMNHLLNRAFEHFAEFETPFDFHTASRKDNPTPVSVSAHIANLLRSFGTSLKQLDQLCDIVAICLVSYIYRSFDFGREPEEIFDEHLVNVCSNGIRLFQEQFLRCALVLGDGTRCVNYVYNHGTQHCSAKNLFWKGSLDRSGFEKPGHKVLMAIKVAFIGMYGELYANNQKKPDLKLISLYRRCILGNKLRLLSELIPRARTSGTADSDSRNDSWSTGRSNKSCFACLQYAPDHVLPCGHGICEECVKDFGAVAPQQPYHYVFSDCPLCGMTMIQWPMQLQPQQPPIPQVIRLNPRCAGLRMLTLDGGGIKGIVELAILEKIEQRVGLDVPIRDLFDLVVGTSTGGIISLALVQAPTDLKVQEIRKHFLTLAEETFKKDRLWPLTVLPNPMIATAAMFLRLVSSRYRSSVLRKSLLNVFNESQPIFGDSRVTGRQRSTRVAVTATSDGEACIFSNYSRTAYDDKGCSTFDDHLVLNKGFERQDNPTREAKVWEAAMATSAAPGFFHEWRIDDPERRRQNNVPFVDGALHSNLPVRYALEERERIWPKSSVGYTKPLDLLVSVGAGKQPNEFHIPSWMNFANSGEAVKAYMKMVFNTDAVWKTFSESPSFCAEQHFRLTIALQERIALDDWQKMTHLLQAVDEAYQNPAEELWCEIETVAYRLAASLLFFEPHTIETLVTGRSRSKIIKGHIWCRLKPGPPMRKLIRRINGFYHREGMSQPTPLQLPVDWKQTLLNREEAGLFFAVPCGLGSTEDQNVLQYFMVSLQPPTDSSSSRMVPISGFPVTFDAMRAGRKQRGQVARDEDKVFIRREYLE